MSDCGCKGGGDVRDRVRAALLPVPAAPAYAEWLERRLAQADDTNAGAGGSTLEELAQATRGYPCDRCGAPNAKATEGDGCIWYRCTPDCPAAPVPADGAGDALRAEVTMSAALYCGDVRAVLASLPAGSAQTCVTSPPYWGLRDYGMPGQLGLEATPEEYVASMVAVFAAVRRVLRDDGTLWLNLGDSYYRKSLAGIPWRVAFALQADGWYLRSEIIWHKPNPMPESVTDRPTKSHETVFLLTKSERYAYDAAAIAEPAEIRPVVSWEDRKTTGEPMRRGDPGLTGATNRTGSLSSHPGTRNARTVWAIATQPYGGAHFATMPEELARRCILAGSKPSDTVLDPFGGSGTTAAVAVGHGRHAVHIDLNPAYIALARERIGPMLCAEMAP